MRPSSLRRDRQKQFNYMTQDEYEQELKKQIEEKKRLQMQEKMQNQQEILNHYKNYQLGADIGSGEDVQYMQDLDQLVRNREREMERMGGAGFQGIGKQNEPFQGDMNAFAQRAQSNLPISIPQGGSDKRPFDLFNDNFVQNYHQLGNPSNNNENLNIINSIFGSGAPSVGQGVGSTGESERERRLKLRELERQKAREGISGGDYGQVQPNLAGSEHQIQPQFQNNIFFGSGENDKPQSSAASKRDQIWQQKMQQRLKSSEGGQRSNPIVATNIVPIAQQNVSQMLPIYQNQGIAPIQNQISGGSVDNAANNINQQNLRSSRVFANLNDARKLDQSINIENQNKTSQQQQQQQPPTGGFLQLGGDDDLIKKRRDNEKRQRQQEYQEFLAKQQKQSGKPPSQNQQEVYNPQSNNISTTVPSSSQSNQRPSYRSASESDQQQLQQQQQQQQQSILQMGGLQQLGMHQQKQQEDKQRMQREYRQMLDLQNQQKQQNQNQPQPLTQDRKKELSDQIFNEIVSQSRQNFYPAQIHSQVDLYQQQQIQQRQQSANGGQRADFFTKNQLSEDEAKKQAQDKKKEYAMQLQQQMALKQQQQSNSDKRRRGTSQVIHQNQMTSEQSIFGQQQFQKPPNVFEYQGSNPSLNMMPQQQFQPAQQLQQELYPQHQPFQPHANMMPQPYDPFIQQPQHFSPPQIHNQLPPLMMHHNPHLSSPLNQGQPPLIGGPQFQPPQQFQQPDPQQLARQKQEEYRRELEMQIKLKEEQKRMQQIDQQLYEQKQDKDFAQLLNQQPQVLQQQLPPQRIHSSNQLPQDYMQQPGQQYSAPGSAQQNFSRQRTDVSKRNNDPEQDQMKALKQLQYQEELQRQMEEKKRQKEEEKRKQKLEDEEYERRLQLEQEQIMLRDHQELVKDGKRDPNAPYMPEKKKPVRRDQFEPSQENTTAIVAAQGAAKQSAWQKAQEVGSSQKELNDDITPKESFTGFQGIGGAASKIELPMNNRREDLFGGMNKKEDLFGQPGGGPSFGGIPSYDQPRFQGVGQDRFQQFNPMSQQPSSSGFNPYGGSQSYGNEPSQQSRQLMDEQSKMIQMYQQALEQILQFRNQYFEQAMQMRENIIKEREQLLEYEKMKQQQNQEISQLQAVYNQLGNLLTSTNQRPLSSNSAISHNYPPQAMITPILNPQVQSNLNNLINSQKQQILRLSQSGGFKFQQQPQYMHQIEEQPNILEQSLSSDTKFVNIPQNKLAQIAQQSVQGPQLFQTWKQDQVINQQQQQYQIQQQQQPQINQSLTASLAGTSQFVQQHQQQIQSQQKSPQKFGSIKGPMIMPTGMHSRPQTSVLPETIQELPNQEDEMNQSNKYAGQAVKQDEEIDFNSRESSPDRHNGQHPKIELKKDNSSSLTVQQNIITNTNPLGNTTTIQENMLQIDQMINGNNKPNLNTIQQLQQNQQQIISPSNKTQEKFHNPTATGSSFYNQTLVHQKQQEQSQMEELQKQLMRIFGNTNNSEQDQSNNIIEQMMQKPATPFQQQQRTQQFVNPLQRASLNEKMNTLSPDEKDILGQSNINIADSITGTQQMQEIVQKANQKFSSNGFYQNLQPYQNDHQQIIDETRIQREDYEDQKLDDQSQQVQEISMNEKPAIQSKQYQQNNFEESSQQHDLWNDPDLIPPPVVMMNNEDDDYYFEPQVNQSMSGFNVVGYNNSMIQDGTLKNLQMFSPPSEEKNYNLAQYDSVSYNNIGESQDVHDQTQRSHNQISAYNQSQMSKHRNNQMDMVSNKSVTKKERDIKDMMEVAKLIQKATDTTNTLFENSQNFKFKIKREQIREANQFNKKPSSQQSQQRSTKNIKTVDPFRNAEQKLQNTTNNQQFNVQQEDDRDNDILGNLDKMIMNLQAQQQKCQEITQSYNDQQYNDQEDIEESKEQLRGRPFSGLPPTNYNQQERSKSNKKNRPVSGNDGVSNHKIGKYAQMALQNQQLDRKSNASGNLGRFAQMAVAQGGVDSEQIINEVQQKYYDQDSQQNKEQYQQYQYQQQNILRPVSGKSNSTRYQQNTAQSQRNKSNGKYPNQPQMFFDEESTDEMPFQQKEQQIFGGMNQDDDLHDGEGTGGFNIGYVRDESQQELEEQ